MKLNYVEDPERKLMEARQAVAGYDKQVVADVVESLFAKGHFDAQKALGADMERIYDETLVGFLLISQEAGVMGALPANERELQSFMKETAMPKIRQSHTRTVEWFMNGLQTHDPMLLQELAERGADFGITEYRQTLGTEVTCYFYNEDGDVLAMVTWDLSQNTFFANWY